MDKLNNEEKEQMQSRLISQLHLSKRFQSSLSPMVSEAVNSTQNKKSPVIGLSQQKENKLSEEMEKKRPFIDSIRNHNERDSNNSRRDGVYLQIENELTIEEEQSTSTPKLKKRQSMSKINVRLQSNKKKTNGNSTFALQEYQSSRLPIISDKNNQNPANKFL